MPGVVYDPNRPDPDEVVDRLHDRPSCILGASVTGSWNFIADKRSVRSRNGGLKVHFIPGDAETDPILHPDSAEKDTFPCDFDKPEPPEECRDTIEDAETTEEALEVLRKVKKRHEEGKGTPLP